MIEDKPTGLASLNGETVKVKADGIAKEEISKERLTQEEKLIIPSKNPSIRGNLKLINELLETVEHLDLRIDILKDSSQSNYEERLVNIENCLAKMAHYNGGNNLRILKEFKIEEYKVQPKDMSRFA